jgi:hypothetical protein
VLAYEYGDPAAAGSPLPFAAFVVNSNGGDRNVTYRNATFFMPAGSTTFLLGNGGSSDISRDGVDRADAIEVLFNTHLVVGAKAIPCNRSFTPLPPGQGALSGWKSWAEPVPPSGGVATHNPSPLEQLNLTKDLTEYMYYTATLPPTLGRGLESKSFNLTIETVEASSFVLFVDGEFVAAVDDHTKGPNAVQLSLPVPASLSTNARLLVLLSGSLGVQNFHGACPNDFRKGVVGAVRYGAVDLTQPPGGWTHRPYLGGELRGASAAGNANATNNVEWGPLGSAPRPLTWFRSTFADPRPAAAAAGLGMGNATLLLDAAGLTRGHLYVNGHDLGRYWTIGALERYYYVPLDTLAPAGQPNVLVVFDELGADPAAVARVTLVVGTLVLPEAGSSC